MTNNDELWMKLKEAAEKANIALGEYEGGVISVEEFYQESKEFHRITDSPDQVLALLAERDADKKRIAELEESHKKLRETMAAIHNTIRADGAYTPLAAIMSVVKRAYEESAAVAGIKLEVGE